VLVKMEVKGTMPQTLDQKRAKHAWDVVSKAKQLDESRKKDFGTELKKLPSRVIASGLGQAMVFLQARQDEKKKPGVKLLIEGVSGWIAHMRPPKGQDKNDIVQRIIQGDSDFLRWATAETLAYLQWLVRLADAEGIKSEVDS
jgi:CRISPR type III-B/RAMP module-associated protein Cmr5